MTGFKRSRFRYLIPPLIFILGLFGSAAGYAGDDDEGGALQIREAKWEDGDQKLVVKGKDAGSRATVVITDKDSGQTIGSVSADSDGDWKFKQMNPAFVPCDVRAQSANGSDTKEVDHAPDDCGVQQPPTNTPPTANANGPYTGTTGTAVSFSSAGSSDPEGSITYRWNFGDGGSSTQPNPSHSYSAAGTYSVSLTVTDSGGLSDSDTTTATITDQPSGNVPPTANANGPYTGTTGMAVSFSSAGSSDPEGNITYAWSFGDGGNSSVANPSHTYGAAGTYNVSLTVTDNGGLSNSDTTTATISDPPQGNLITDPVSEQPFVGNQGFKVLAANDLGMHCADLDYQIFSILPPFNVVHAQVIERGGSPNLVTQASHPNMSVVYSAALNPNDPTFDPANPTMPPSLNLPAAALMGTARAGVSINSTSQNDSVAGVFKTNFWDINLATGNPLGFDAYDNLFFGLLNAADVVADTGLPVPDSMLLVPDINPCLADPNCLGVQEMPGISAPYVANVPKAFDRFDMDFNFFSGVLGAPLGSVIQGVNWFAADAIAMSQVDDAGRVNAYPLMRIQALDGSTVVASTDVVLPVASEADCQNCHADPIDCADPDLPPLLQSNNCTGAAADPADFDVAMLSDAPGDTVEQQLLNAAKINVLRLHDVDHGAGYPAGWGDGSGCDAAANPQDASLWNGNCLANSTPIQCSQCHYSPALDLAQLGPTDQPASQVFQTAHASMSSVMHGFHGALQENGQLMFPDMPAPDQTRDTQGVLEETCYQCHPGKRTQCLRGAMAAGGVVCQDCHGQMADVGHDFTTGGSRVPWASEPKCQSCHTGDAATPNHPLGAIVAGDGIRLLQAYVGNNANAPITSPNSRFAENESLYRLSGNEVTTTGEQGHQGIMCEGCHGSTHAIWPNANPNANDNVAATQLQGHSGTLVECSTCHTGDLGNTLDGPHGMHPVGDTGFADGGHEKLTNDNGDGCHECHGPGGRKTNVGTVLSVAKADRNLPDAGFVPEGTVIGCTTCHSSGGGD